MGPVAAWLKVEEEEEQGCTVQGCATRGLQSLCPTRHLLNVTWEHRDFSFNEGGYLVRPTMVVITLNQHRLWEMVGPPGSLGWAHCRVAVQGEPGAMHRLGSYLGVGRTMQNPKVSWLVPKIAMVP